MIQVTEAELLQWLSRFLWPFVRALAMLAAAPVLGHDAVPARVKIGLAAALALVLSPLMPASMPSVGSAEALPTLVTQVMAGFALGFTARLAFAAVELAGDLIGLQMGLSFATFVDPQNSTPAPLVGSFLGVMAMLIFLCLDGHLALVGSLAESFHTMPPGTPVSELFNAKMVVKWGSELFRLGLHISLPVLAALLIANLALAVLARAAPQLNIFSVGFPASLMLGLAVLAGSLPIVAPLIEAALRTALGLATGR